MGIYQDLRVKTYINAWDAVSAFGGTRMAQTTLDAMESASRSTVDLSELQRAVGLRIADLTRNEAAMVTSGATSALLHAAAACIQGDRNEIVIPTAQRTGFEAASRIAGARIVYADDLQSAIGDKTCAIFFFDFLAARAASLSFEETVPIARQRGIPLIVDAAAQIPPIENLWRFTQNGADAACFSGGKALRGPQSSGLLLGKKWLLDRALSLKDGATQSARIGREEIVGVYAALLSYLRPGAEEAKIAVTEARAAYIRAACEATGSMRCQIIPHGPVGQSYAMVGVSFADRINPRLAAERLREAGILVGVAEEGIVVNPLLLEDDETDQVIRAITDTIHSVHKAPSE